MGRDVWSGQLHCRMSYPCPISCPLASNTVHQSVHLQWSVQSTFALPPPPPRLLSLARPDPGYILTRHGLTLAMSRTGQDRGRLQDFRSTIQIFQVSKKAHFRKNACLHLEDFVHVYFTICQSQLGFSMLKNLKSTIPPEYIITRGGPFN